METERLDSRHVYINGTYCLTRYIHVALVFHLRDNYACPWQILHMVDSGVVGRDYVDIAHATRVRPDIDGKARRRARIRCLMMHEQLGPCSLDESDDTRARQRDILRGHYTNPAGLHQELLLERVIQETRETILYEWTGPPLGRDPAGHEYGTTCATFVLVFFRSVARELKMPHSIIMDESNWPQVCSIRADNILSAGRCCTPEHAPSYDEVLADTQRLQVEAQRRWGPGRPN